MNIATKILNDQTIIKVSGRFDIISLFKFRERIKLLEKENKLNNLMVDLQDVSFISPVAIVELQILKLNLSYNNRNLYLCNISKCVKNALNIFMMEEIFNIRSKHIN